MRQIRQYPVDLVFNQSVYFAVRAVGLVLDAALDILKKNGFIAVEDHAVLSNSYAFFRRLLNRARMMRGSSSAKIPDTPETLHRLAVCLALEDDVMEAVENHAHQVHDAYCRIVEQAKNNCT